MMTKDQKWQWYKTVFLPLVHKEVEKTTTEGLWYEVWIDLDEMYGKWFYEMYNHTEMSVKRISKWLIRRDKWYWSDEYVEELDNAMETNEDATMAFQSILDNSLKRPTK